jgi:D-glycero-alpha-D-manno-heptose-7-phosphate kinase
VIITRTPFRISLFGGGTDYPAWYRRHGGVVLSATIDKYCYLTCRYLPPFFEHRFRIVYSMIEDVKTIDEIVHPAAREVLRFCNVDRGVEIHHDGDLPARSGTGSSSAFTVGLLHAIYALQGKMPARRQLALDAIHVEQDLLKENVWCQYQIAAAYGGFNLITMAAPGDFRVSPMTVRPERLQSLQSHLMLYYTGLSRTASSIAQKQIRETRNKKGELRAMYDMVFEALEILNGRASLTEFGRLLHRSWMLKRTLTDQTSTPFIDGVYETARKAGAIGGKLLGAGGGGFFLLFAQPGRQARIREKLKRLLHVPFRFEREGSQVIVYRPEEEIRPA